MIPVTPGEVFSTAHGSVLLRARGESTALKRGGGQIHASLDEPDEDRRPRNLNTPSLFISAHRKDKPVSSAFAARPSVLEAVLR